MRCATVLLLLGIAVSTAAAEAGPDRRIRYVSYDPDAVKKRLRKEGVNELHLLAQDAAGNEARLTHRAYVESY